MIGKWIQKIKKNKRQLGVGALALFLAGVMGVNLLSNQAITTYALETQVEADAGTQDSWQDYKTNSTQYTGRIWTDKSVYKENVTLTDLEGSQTQTIEKPDTSDFLVSLSALSSASTLVTTTTTPLDIVLVLDVSGSMSDEMTETRIIYEEYRTSGNRANNVGDAWQDEVIFIILQMDKIILKLI